MSRTIDSNSRLVDVTLGDLADYLRACGFMTAADLPVADTRQSQNRAPKPELVGIKGLADYLHLSENTAGKYYRAGVFDSAVVKVGDRNLRFDRELASEAARKRKGRK